MTDRTSPIKPPIQASPGRRVVHTSIAIAGWVLFVYWWWIVFHRVSAHEIRFTVLFVLVALVLVVSTTALWAWHNTRIFRRKGPRRWVREATPDYSRDRVGRPVTFAGAGSDQSTAPVVLVRFTGEGKLYEPVAVVPRRTGARVAAAGRPR